MTSRYRNSWPIIFRASFTGVLSKLVNKCVELLTRAKWAIASRLRRKIPTSDLALEVVRAVELSLPRGECDVRCDPCEAGLYVAFNTKHVYASQLFPHGTPMHVIGMWAFDKSRPTW